MKRINTLVSAAVLLVSVVSFADNNDYAPAPKHQHRLQKARENPMQEVPTYYPEQALQQDSQSVSDVENVYKGPTTGEKVVVGGEGAGVAGGVTAHVLSNRKMEKIWREKLPNQEKGLDDEKKAFEKENAAYQAEDAKYSSLTTEYDHAAHGYDELKHMYLPQTVSLPNGRGGTTTSMIMVDHPYTEHHAPDLKQAHDLEPKLAPAKVSYEGELARERAEEQNLKNAEETLAKAKLELLSADTAEAAALRSELKMLKGIKIAGDVTSVLLAGDLLYKGYLYMNEQKLGTFPLGNAAASGVEGVKHLISSEGSSHGSESKGSSSSGGSNY